MKSILILGCAFMLCSGASASVVVVDNTPVEKVTDFAVFAPGYDAVDVVVLHTSPAIIAEFDFVISPTKHVGRELYCKVVGFAEKRNITRIRGPDTIRLS